MYTIKAFPAFDHGMYAARSLVSPLLAQWASIFFTCQGDAHRCREEFALRPPVMTVENIDRLWSLGMLSWIKENGRLLFSAALPCVAQRESLQKYQAEDLADAIKRVRGAK
jgi:hypothetical protein